LDYYRLSEADPSKQPGIVERQKRAFIQQLELAADAGLNCIIHQRAAWDDTMEIWAPFSDRVRAVFHCFVGTPEEADQVIQRGGSVSFTGITTFKSAETVRRTLAAVPSDRYFLETDCPFLAPTPYRGKRCEPAYVLEIAQEVARVRGTTLEQVSQETCANVHRFFDRLTR
jgi:TatD DNase family protein